MAIPFGEPIPLGDEHAICVSLPEWDHSIGFSCQDAEVLGALKAGYPRFSLHRLIAKLEQRLIDWAASPVGHPLAVMPEEAIKLFPSEAMAKTCEKYLRRFEACKDISQGRVRVSHVTMHGALEIIGSVESNAWHEHPEEHVYSVTYPNCLARHAWKFWLHTGYGISSRFAAFWLTNAKFLCPESELETKEAAVRAPVGEAKEANEAIREHISRCYSTRETKVTTGDVFLFQGGMVAVTQTAMSLSKLCSNQAGKENCHRVVIFGFLYTDTMKVLGDVLGYETIHYGHGSVQDLHNLESELKSGRSIDVLYTEFPTNPLLKVVDLKRLHALAIQYGFILVVDDTIGTPINVLVAPLCDVICTSLTKAYSGAANVMGGSVVVSPWSRHHDVLCTTLASHHEDTYFSLDLLVMHTNGLQFEQRVIKASKNALCLADFLRRHRLVTEVLYPSGGPTQSLYDTFKRSDDAGYGFLLSIRFCQAEVAVTFYDALETAKGPSFGTNFTLACPYTVLAHYGELDWASEFGVSEDLVRVSVGVEDIKYLYDVFGKALAAAETFCCE